MLSYTVCNSNQNRQWQVNIKGLHFFDNHITWTNKVVRRMAVQMILTEILKFLSFGACF